MQYSAEVRPYDNKLRWEHRMKRHTVKLFSLITGLALSLAAFFAVTVFSVSAESYSAVNIFTTSVGASYDQDAKDNVTYEMGEESTVSYRKNLALKWYERGENEAVGSAKYFTTTIAFDGENFSKFSMKLEAAQHTMNKEEKSENTLTFEADNGAYTAYVNDQKEAGVSVTAQNGEFVIALTEAAIDDKPALDGTTGEFYVTVNGKYAGTFTNIGSNYAEYSSSSLTPLTFSLDELKEGGADKQKVEIRKLNNQSMALDKDSGKIADDAAPIFVLNDEVKVLKLGDTLDFDYKNIDVLDSSVSTEFYSFVFKGTDTDKDPDETAEDETDKGLYYEKSDTLSKVVFMENDLYNGTDNAYVSVAFRLSDGDNHAFYYLEDYALSAKVDGSTKEYVRVSKKVDSRPVYTGTAADYQKAVETASRNDEGKSIQIGTGAYYYLPSLRSLISDADCGYTELTFDVYYKNQTTESGSATGLSYNELKFEIATAGKYEFKVVAKNKFGNVMQYEKDGKTYNVTSSNVWDVEEIPSFTFDVYNNGPSIEESEINDLGYIDVTFTFPAFEIVGLSGYSSEYKLYRLDGDSSSLTLDEVNSDPSKYTWKEIEEYDSDKEEDEGDNVYEWRPSSRSFIPQEKGFYMITVKVVDDGGFSAESHQVVNVTSEVDTVHGETYWLRDNVLSVVFMAIGGLCLIGIIVLLVIKPKEESEVVSVKKARKEELKEKRENRNKKQ